MRKFALLALLLLCASVAQAATTNISGGGSGVLSAAITAATAGDTINITDSATYTETQLNITKLIYITADPGQTPTITNAGALTANAFLIFGTGSGGTTTANCTKFGSLSGGRITIEYQTQASPAFADAIIRFKQGTSLHAILENVNVIETGTNVKINGMMHNYTTKEFITLNYVDIDLGVTPVLNYATSGAGFNQAAGIMCPGDMNNYSGSQEVYNLNHVRIKNFGSVGICAQNTQCVLNMSYCDLGTLGATSNNPQWPAACIYNRHPAVPFTANIDHCIFRAPAVGCAVNFGGGGTTSAYPNPTYGTIPNYTSVTVTRSVFLSKYPANKAGVSGSYFPGVGSGYGTVLFYPPRGSTGWVAARPQQIHFDHCDIVDMTTATYTNVACIARPSWTQANWATSLTLTNTNVYSANNAGLRNLAASTYPFSLIEDHNNWYSSQSNSPATSGLNLDPGYVYPEVGDVRYSNAALKTADALGGPIGVNAAYFDAVSNIETSKLGVRYLANPLAGGTIDSATSTTYNINSGDSIPAKTAAVNAHYTWGGWSDGNMSLSRTDSAVTDNKLFKANFIIDTYTVNYAAGANGEVTGTLAQTIGWNETGTAVTAIPATGYHFTQWEDALTSNPRTDYNVTANATHTASFGINSYNYSYVAGVGGTVNGDAILTGTTNYNTSGPSVTAAPSTGYVFAKWLDNDSTNPTRQDVITADFNTTATFNALTQYTLTYTAGAGGTITGDTPQTVGQGFNGTEVVAVPNAGYHFVDWSDGIATAARTDLNVTGNINVTANFAINTYTLTYTAGTNGSITGTLSQTVNYNGSGSEVVAVPDSGFRFVSWSDGVLTAARTDSNVTANKSVTATFASNSCTLTYTAGTGGTITGSLSQTVTYGGNGTQVTAVPNSGYTFVSWSDGVLTAARTDMNVTGDISVTAMFTLPSIKVPTDYGTIQAAINAASEGGTVEIVNSATYKENLRINKSVNLVATAGQAPKIEQLDNTTTCPVILGLTASPSTIQLGSISGGKITFQYMKWGISTGGVMPVGQIYMGVTTGSTVRIENCDIISTGTNTYTPVTGIAHHQNPCSVTVRYTNINCNRGNFNAGGDSANRGGCTGIDLSNNSPTAGATITRRIPGPAYTLDHVRIKGYVRAGLWLHYTSMTLTASNIDVGTYGENTVAGSNIPWGPLVSFTAASSWTGRIDHSLFQGPLNYAAFGKIGPAGTSISLSRCVLLGSGGTNANYGTLDVGTNAAATTGNPIKMTVDHCDLVHLGASPASALSRTVNNNVLNLKITNSNIYSKSAQAINMTQIASPNTFSSSYNNVYGPTASVGYTADITDLALDPGYTNAATGDVRYSNTTVRRSDSAHGPIGVNADYTDVFNIVDGDNTTLNRAHGWTMMK